MIIAKESLEGMFQNIRQKTKWNIDGDMLWGYFFTSPNREPLVPASENLAGQGYRVVNIYLDDAKENWWLHVEKTEKHTVDSLDKRNQELDKFAKAMNLGDYDGMDVGPTIGPISHPHGS